MFNQYNFVSTLEYGVPKFNLCKLETYRYNEIEFLCCKL